MTAQGKVILLPGGKRGLLPGGKAAIQGASPCSPCCGIPCCDIDTCGMVFGSGAIRYYDPSQVCSAEQHLKSNITAENGWRIEDIRHTRTPTFRVTFINEVSAEEIVQTKFCAGFYSGFTGRYLYQADYYSSAMDTAYTLKFYLTIDTVDPAFDDPALLPYYGPWERISAQISIDLYRTFLAGGGGLDADGCPNININDPHITMNFTRSTPQSPETPVLPVTMTGGSSGTDPATVEAISGYSEPYVIAPFDGFCSGDCYP